MLTPKEIHDKIITAPPMQQTKVGESYAGIKISWKVYYQSAYAEKGVLRVRSRTSESYLDFTLSVLFNIENNKYPEFNVLQTKAPLWVEGVILKADTFDIYLKDVSIKFKDENEKQPLHSDKPQVVNHKVNDTVKIHKPLKKNWREVLTEILITIICSYIIYKLGWS